MSKRLTRLWVEKYRPATLASYLFQNPQHKQQFEKMVAEKEIPHILLSGVQGTGKTTMSLALVNELGIDDNDVMLIKASEETGVDAMRDKIKSFAQSYALSAFKIVRLEEMDFLTPNAQGALRTVMEDYSDNCRFIGTCNYENKIMPAVKSRFQHFHFKAPDKNELTVHIAEILAEEGVEFDLDTLDKIVTIGYPDIRYTINLAQQHSVNKTLTIAEAATTTDWRFGVIDFLTKGDFKTVRKLVCENASREEFEDLYRFLYQNLTKIKGFDQAKQDAATIIIANYLYRHSLVADPELNFAACLIELSQLI